MDLNHVWFEIFGLKITYLSVGAAIVGSIPAVAAMHRAYDWWVTREERHLALLHEYLDKEEKNISARRRDVLDSISLAHHSYLDDKRLDVASEIDDAVIQLDQGRPDRAQARLKELLKKVRSNTTILERRVVDLRKHERSLNIFLAAVEDSQGQTRSGLDYVEAALQSDGYDPDALKYKGLLLAKDGDLPRAEQAFNKLLQNATGNKAERAEAYCGLGSIAMHRGVAYYDEAGNYLKNALNNLNGLPPSEQSSLTKAVAHELLGKLLETGGWSGHSPVDAKQHFERSLATLEAIPGRSAALRDRTNTLRQRLN